MKIFRITASIVITSLMALSAAHAKTTTTPLMCEQQHKTAIKKLKTIANSLSSAKLKKIMISGKASGIKLSELTEAEKTAAVKAYKAKAPKIKLIVAGVKCESSVSTVQALKGMFNSDSMISAATLLSSANGLNGLGVALDARIKTLTAEARVRKATVKKADYVTDPADAHGNDSVIIEI